MIWPRDLVRAQLRLAGASILDSQPNVGTSSQGRSTSQLRSSRPQRLTDRLNRSSKSLSRENAAEPREQCPWAQALSSCQPVGILQSAGPSAGMLIGPSTGTSKKVARNWVTVVPELYAVCTWPCPGSRKAFPAA